MYFSHCLLLVHSATLLYGREPSATSSNSCMATVDDLVACFLIRLHVLGNQEVEYGFTPAEAPTVADSACLGQMLEDRLRPQAPSFLFGTSAAAAAEPLLHSVQSKVSAGYGRYLGRVVSSWLASMTTPDAVADVLVKFQSMLGETMEPTSLFGRVIRKTVVKVESAMFTGLSTLFEAVQATVPARAASVVAPAAAACARPIPSLHDEIDDLHQRFDKAVVPMVSFRSGAVAGAGLGACQPYSTSCVTQYGCLDMASLHASRGQYSAAVSGVS